MIKTTLEFSSIGILAMIVAILALLVCTITVLWIERRRMEEHQELANLFVKLTTSIMKTLPKEKKNEEKPDCSINLPDGYSVWDPSKDPTVQP